MAGLRLEGKTAFVTGAASGLGKAIAAAFVAEGARVALADIDRGGGERAVRELGSAALFLEHDVGDEASWVKSLDAAVAAMGGLTILVNNAGVARLGDVEHTTLEEWRFVHRVNLDGVFLGCKHSISRIAKSGGGAIVNMSSVAGLIGVHNMAAYCSSKGAVRLLTKSVAMHCARRRYGIRCNSIHPVYVDTPMVDAMLTSARDPERTRQALAEMIPLGRLGRPEEVAQMAVYLASDESSLVTGAEFVIDGGLSAT
ncbi:MAG: glucose 1-dehydrogenase [Acidobacteriota bacterium]